MFMRRPIRPFPRASEWRWLSNVAWIVLPWHQYWEIWCVTCCNLSRKYEIIRKLKIIMWVPPVIHSCDRNLVKLSNFISEISVTNKKTTSKNATYNVWMSNFVHLPWFRGHVGTILMRRKSSIWPKQMLENGHDEEHWYENGCGNESERNGTHWCAKTCPLSLFIESCLWWTRLRAIVYVPLLRRSFWFELVHSLDSETNYLNYENLTRYIKRNARKKKKKKNYNVFQENICSWLMKLAKL